MFAPNNTSLGSHLKLRASTTSHDDGKHEGKNDEHHGWEKDAERDDQKNPSPLVKHTDSLSAGCI